MSVGVAVSTEDTRLTIGVSLLTVHIVADDVVVCLESDLSLLSGSIVRTDATVVGVVVSFGGNASVALRVTLH